MISKGTIKSKPLKWVWILVLFCLIISLNDSLSSISIVLKLYLYLIIYISLCYLGTYHSIDSDPKYTDTWLYKCLITKGKFINEWMRFIHSLVMSQYCITNLFSYSLVWKRWWYPCPPRSFFVSRWLSIVSHGKQRNRK
jgi:hypothetical protein